MSEPDYLDPTRDVDRRVDDLVARMTIEEKAGQLFHTMALVGPGGELAGPLEPLGLPAVSDLVLERSMTHFNMLGSAPVGDLAVWHNRLQDLALETRLQIPITVSTDPRHAFTENTGTGAVTAASAALPPALSAPTPASTASGCAADTIPVPNRFIPELNLIPATDRKFATGGEECAILDGVDPIETVDYHTAGEPFRVVVGGVPVPEGSTVLERRSWSQEHLDDVRALLINEPRGHADMYGCFVTPPDDADGDIGVVFFHKDGFSTACGHGTIALVTWALDSGRLARADGDETAVVVDVPSGRLHAVATRRSPATADGDGRVDSVRFRNVPSFVTATGLDVTTARGPLQVDVSYGGAFYASVSLDGADLAPRSEDLGALIGLGRQVKAGITDRHRDTVTHSDERLSGLYGVIFHETLGTDPLHQRNVTVFADGEVDRSPCGSGTSARLALLAHHGTLDVGEPFLNEGVAGGVFEGRVEERQGESVITSISGSAYRTSTATFVLDRRDPIGLGFQLR